MKIIWGDFSKGVYRHWSLTWLKLWSSASWCQRKVDHQKRGVYLSFKNCKANCGCALNFERRSGKIEMNNNRKSDRAECSWTRLSNWRIALQQFSIFLWYRISKKTLLSELIRPDCTISTRTAPFAVYSRNCQNCLNYWGHSQYVSK